MVISNNGKMRKIKEQILYALQKEMLLYYIGGTIDGRVVTKEELEELLININRADVMNNIKIVDLTREEIKENPYLKNLTINEEVVGNVRYASDRVIKKNGLARYREDYRDLETFELHKEFFRCNKFLKFPMLRDINSNVCWMTAEPHETNTLSSFVDNAYGNVLVCGCGIGYTAYMLSLKENVESITILENNKNTIELFKRQVLPFINKKVNIIMCDANEYIEKEDLSIYDYINIDLWYDTPDMAYPYIKGLIKESEYPNTHFTYWIESSLLTEIQFELLSYIATGDFINAIPNISTLASHIISLSNDTITDSDSIKRFISFENIKSKLIEFGIKYPDILGEINKNGIESQAKCNREVTNFINQKTLGTNPLSKKLF